ncbi:MAG: amidohydrolase family protein [Candidatus Korobacteraceae bacterium]
MNPETVPDPQAALRVVREQKNAGYDHLKILGALSLEAYDAVAAAAKKYQLDFTGHVPPAVGPLHAMRAGQRTIDHMDRYVESLGPGVEAIDTDKMAALVTTAVETGVWTVPTMAYRDNAFSNETGDELRRRYPEVKYLPKSHIDDWVRQKDETVENAKGRPAQGFTRGGETGEHMRALRCQMLRALHEGGARVVFGTDSPQLFNVPGFAIHHEMRMMVQCGFTPYEVLDSATVKAAEYFGTSAEVGTIASGKRADLMLLEANPLEDIVSVVRRAGVMVRGHWIPESEIQQRLARYAESSAKN